MKAINERKNRNGNILLSDGTSLGANIGGIGYEELNGIIRLLMTGMHDWRNFHFSQNPFGRLGEISEDQIDKMLNPSKTKNDDPNETDAMKADDCFSAKSPTDDEIDEMLNPSKNKKDNINQTDAMRADNCFSAKPPSKDEIDDINLSKKKKNDVIKAELQTTVLSDYRSTIDSSSYDETKVTIDLVFDEVDIKKPNMATNLMSNDDSDESIIDLTSD